MKASNNCFEFVFITLLSLLVAVCFVPPAVSVCGEVKGSYGTIGDNWADLLGIACSGQCFLDASRWSRMAIKHGDRRVNSSQECLSLCLRTAGCQVWTLEQDSGTCRAMRRLSKGPTLLDSDTNAITGGSTCEQPFLVYPESLPTYVPEDVGDVCFRPGYLYGEGDGNDPDCFDPPPRAKLIAVHAPEYIINRGEIHGWWKELEYGIASNVKLVSTGKHPLEYAADCAKLCINECGGFSFTRGICFLREKVRGEEYSLNLTCPAPTAELRRDAIAGPSAGGACIGSRRKVPSPQSDWFEKCDLPRCPGVHTEQGKIVQWDLGAGFPEATRNFAFQPGNNGDCYFPMYNRSEIIHGILQPKEAWVFTMGGSNSYGLGSNTMKVVHDDGFGNGYSLAEANANNKWNKRCIVDTIRYADGRKVVRPHGSGGCGVSYNGMLGFLRETEKLYEPGSIRVTHAKAFLYDDTLVWLKLATRDENPWKSLLFYSHSVQRYGNDANKARNDLGPLLEEAKKKSACANESIVCAIGTPLSHQAIRPAQKEFTFPSTKDSPIHLLDYDRLSDNKKFEVQSAHGLSSLHLLSFQILLNLFELKVSLTEDQRSQALSTTGCPEALMMYKNCWSANSVKPWDAQCQYPCYFKRDEITPVKGSPAFFQSREEKGGEEDIPGKDDTIQPNITDDDNETLPAVTMVSTCKASAYTVNFNLSLEEPDSIFQLKKRPLAQCKKRVWCGFEYQAWWLGMGSLLVVGFVHMLKIMFFQYIEQLDFGKKSKPIEKVRTLDPGNGGTRTKSKRASLVAKSTRKLMKRQSIGVTKSNKPLSTVTGERLTSLGPARFMASMWIVAGHMYQKNAIGPQYFLSWGYTWVPWFFMLSGYVLTHARLNSRKPDRVDLPLVSLWKRTSSIYPMYAVGVVLDMMAFIAKGQPLPDFSVLIAQSFLLQAWYTEWAEKALQQHCWFLSAMVMYWLGFGPVYKFIRGLALKKLAVFMIVLCILPWLSVVVPSATGDLAFYKVHRHGSFKTGMDHLTVLLKFHPLCYIHVFLFGMALARFRRHVTRRDDAFETGVETQGKGRKVLHKVLLVPFRLGAVIGYVCLITAFLVMGEAGKAKAKISARLGILMPLQGLILLGLSPLKGYQVNGGRGWQWGADPLANMFKIVPGWIGDVSYAHLRPHSTARCECGSALCHYSTMHLALQHLLTRSKSEHEPLATHDRPSEKEGMD